MGIVGLLLIVFGVFAGIIPFVGPLFDFGMGPDPAWVATWDRVVRHVIPAAAIVAGGVLLLPRFRPSRALGGLLAVAGGVWLTVAPVVLGRVTEATPPMIDVLRPLTYHYGIGVIVAALAGYAVGHVVGARTGAEYVGRAPVEEGMRETART